MVYLKQKALLREVMKNKREQLTNAAVAKASLACCEKIIATAFFKKAKAIAVYFAINNEIDLSLVTVESFRQGKSLVVPVHTPNGYVFSLFNKGDTLAPGPFDVPQPQEVAEFPAGNLELVLVPGLAFSALGNRVGYGKGIYDELLRDTSATLVGVGYDFQVLVDVPLDEGDVQMDYVVTEKRRIKLISRLS